MMGTGGKFQEMRQENSDSRQQINQNHKDMASGLELSYFIRADLTNDEQVALKNILDSQRSSVEATMKDSSLSTDDKTTKLKTIFSENIPAVLQYVSSDKQDEFKSMMDKRLADIISNIGLHGKIQDNREMMKSGSGDTLSQMKKETRPAIPQSVLSQSLKTKLDTAISNFSVERLQKILSNIDAAITKVQPTTSNDKKKAMLVMQLKEIRDIVATKINELNGGVDDVLGSILNDTTTSSGFGQ